MFKCHNVYVVTVQLTCVLRGPFSNVSDADADLRGRFSNVC